MEQNKVDSQQNPQSFKLYTGKAPWPVQIVSGFMWLSGILSILSGIPLLLAFGLGVIPIAIGALSIKYARSIFKMQRKGYVGGMVLIGLGMLYEIIMFFARGGSEGLPTVVYIIFLAFGLLLLGILYAHREKFVN